MSNQLVQVTRFMEDTTANLSNNLCIASTSNGRYENFENIEGNLGSSVNIQMPYRIRHSLGLSATTSQSIIQRFITLTVNQSANIRVDIQNLEEIFNRLSTNGEQLRRLKVSCVKDLASLVDNQLAQQFALNTYRAYTLSSSTSYTDLQKAVDRQEAYGSPGGKFKVYIPTQFRAFIIGNGLGQFAPTRNDDQVHSWQLGDCGNSEYYISNLLNTHTAGLAGQLGTVLTNPVVSLDGTSVTFTSTDPNTTGYIAAGDIIQFAILPNAGVYLNAVTYTGMYQQPLAVQVVALASADLVGGAVTVNVSPSLISSITNQDQYISRPIVSTDTATVSPSHIAGAIVSGDAFFTAFPKLPLFDPWKSVVTQDEETGVALRFRHGATDFAEPTSSAVIDTIWDSVIASQYLTRLIIPLSVINNI